MLLSYLKIALHNLMASKLYSAINLLGLAIGLAGTLVIGLFVLDELSYDKHYADADRIYRVSRDFPTQGSGLYLAANAPLVAPLLKADFPEIEQSARIFGGQALLSHDDKAFYESNIRFADNEIFDIFSLEWISGDASDALTRPFTIVLTESIATKYFGNAPALGQTLTLENQVPVEVTGVIRDLPRNTHLDLSVIVSLSTVAQIVGERFLQEWGGNNFHTYIRLQPGVSIDSIASRFPDFLNRHFVENASTFTGMTAMPIADIHLHSTRQFEMSPPGSMNTVYVFSAAALFILLIACFNFMNLSTARSTRRGKEVGMRKALGASRGQIAGQFVGESVLLTVIASVMALVLVEVVLPSFNAFLGKELALNLFSEPLGAAAFVALIAVVGLFAGSYPAFFLSAFKPVQVLRSALAASGSMLFRNTLVVLQFAIAIILVVATLVVTLQMNFARNIELGFRQEQILVLTGSPTAGLGPQWEAMRAELLRNPDILAVTASAQTPLQINTNGAGVRAEGQEQGTALPFMRVDYDFFSTYDIPVLAGHGFSADFPADRVFEPVADAMAPEAGFVINQLAAEQLGWTPEAALGKSMTVSFNKGPHAGQVVGVVGNSYFESARNAIKPMVFVMPEYFVDGEALLQNASLRLSGNDLQATLAYVDRVWTQFMPDFPMSRAFLDDNFDALYQAETRQGSVFYAFALLAIFIACMGLYGLASFNAERRRKEIGVRKVMGGSVWGIVLLLT
ncbi:MAG: ABC transporter permease, partial [Pseudomonadota bacterium]